MRELTGQQVVDAIRTETEKTLEALNGYVPTLAIVRVGENVPQLSYERGAKKRMQIFGLDVKTFVFPEDVTPEVFFQRFREINADPCIDGVLLLKPLPEQLDVKRAERSIDPEKDLDGISPVNIARVFAGEEEGFAPCTAEAVIETLRTYEIPVHGKRAVVVGRSLVVGRTLAMLLLRDNATVTICHTKTSDLKEECRKAEILAVAAGKAKLVNRDYVSEGCVILDVGINADEDGNLCGDVNPEGLENVAAALTPVPRGIGAVTTSVLAKHLVQAAARRRL